MERARGLVFVHQVDLVDHDHRLRAAIPDRGEIALEASRVEIAVGGRDQKEDIDVGGHHLGVRRLAGGAANQRAAAVEEQMDARVVVVVADRDPVARGRARRGVVGMTQPAGELAEARAAAGEFIDVAAVGAHARRHPALGAVEELPLCGKERMKSELFEKSLRLQCKRLQIRRLLVELPPAAGASRRAATPRKIARTTRKRVERVRRAGSGCGDGGTPA